jgi:hypothetical protein
VAVEQKQQAQAQQQGACSKHLQEQSSCAFTVPVPSVLAYVTLSAACHLCEVTAAGDNDQLASLPLWQLQGCCGLKQIQNPAGTH